MLNKLLKSLVLLAIIQGTNVNSMETSEQPIINIISSSNITVNNSRTQEMNYTNSYSNGNINSYPGNSINLNNIKSDNINDALKNLSNLYKKSTKLSNQKKKYQATETLLGILKKSSSSEDFRKNFSNLDPKDQTLIVNYLEKLNKNKSITQEEIFETYGNIKSNGKEIIRSNNKYLRNVKKTNSEIDALKKNIKDYIPNIIQEKLKLENLKKFLEDCLQSKQTTLGECKENKSKIKKELKKHKELQAKELQANEIMTLYIDESASEQIIERLEGRLFRTEEKKQGIVGDIKDIKEEKSDIKSQISKIERGLNAYYNN